MTGVRTIPCCVCTKAFRPVRAGVLACSRICGAARKVGKSTPPCRHGLHVEVCRECLPCGLTVSEFVHAFPEPTLEEMAAALGVTRQRVEQIVNATLLLVGGARGVDHLEDVYADHDSFSAEPALGNCGGLDAD